MKGWLKVDSDYQCKKCSVNGTTVGTESGKKKILLESSESIECVEEFCYLGDMLNCGGGAGAASRVRVGCAWKKFRELNPILTARGAYLKLKSKIYSACVRSSMIYGSETWSMKAKTRKGREDDGKTYVWSHTEGQEVL